MNSIIDGVCSIPTELDTAVPSIGEGWGFKSINWKAVDTRVSNTWSHASKDHRRWGRDQGNMKSHDDGDRTGHSSKLLSDNHRIRGRQDGIVSLHDGDVDEAEPVVKVERVRVGDPDVRHDRPNSRFRRVVVVNVVDAPVRLQLPGHLTDPTVRLEIGLVLPVGVVVVHSVGI